MMNKNLRVARLKKNWSQEEAAEALRVGVRTYQRWERGEATPNFQSRRLLSHVFEVSDEVLGFAPAYEEPLLSPSPHYEEFAPSCVIQYEQKQQAPEQEASLSPDSESWISSEYGVLFPASLFALEKAETDSMSWFTARIKDVEALVAPWQERAISSSEQQALIHTALEQWDQMTDQMASSPDEYRISRRMALATLATLSSSLLTKVQLGPLTPLIIKEFLAQCATSITTCWHLLQGRELLIVKQALTSSLPVLSSWAKEPSSYQKESAYLASQGYLLMGLLSLHSLPPPQNFQQRMYYCTQAAEYAQLSNDSVLVVTALAHLGNAYYDTGHLSGMLQTYQKAVITLDAFSKQQYIPLLLQSKLQVELAHAYAQHGQLQESLRALEEAQALFPKEQEQAPVFLSTDYGKHSLLLFQGLVHLDLDRYAPKNNHAHQAANALAEIGSFSTKEHIPERFRVEITNQQALAAIKDGNMEQFRQYLIEGIEGAHLLKSQKRKDEAVKNWREARKKWPHEVTVLELADLLL